MAAVEEELRLRLRRQFWRGGLPAIAGGIALLLIIAPHHPMLAVSVAVALLLLAGPYFYLLTRRPLQTLALLHQAVERLNQELPADEQPGETPRTTGLQSTIRRATARLQQMEEAVLARSEFIANASHELRTPVTSLGVLLESLMRGAKDDPQLLNTFLLDLQREAERLHVLVDDLLDVAKYEAGADGLAQESVDMVAVISDTMSSLYPLAQQRDVRLQQEIAPELPCLQGDPVALSRLVANLLANAIKFTPPGGQAFLSARAREGVLELRVRDTGIGIPPEALPHIFERFYCVDRARSRVQGGSGLGLAIAQQIARAHGGTIDVESVIGEGTTFTCTLPLSA